MTINQLLDNPDRLFIVAATENGSQIFDLLLGI
jgi:hypothetical protein